MTAKLTICIPTYNRANALDNCLGSICAQAVFDDVEIIVLISDNASTDNTKEIVDKWVSKFDFIHYHKKNVNIGGVRNFWSVTSLVDTEFFWLMGDDAFLMPGSIKHALNILQSDSEVNLILMSGTNVLSDQTEPVRNQLDNDTQIFKSSSSKLFLCSFWLQTLGCISYLIVRASLWKKTGYNLQPSFFIYPQIRSLIDLTDYPGSSVFSNRLCVVNTRAMDSHNDWYRDKACLSIAIEFPCLQEYAIGKGLHFRVKNGLHKKYHLWKIRSVTKAVLIYPVSFEIYKEIIKFEDNIFVRCVLILLIFFLVIFRSALRVILLKMGVISKSVEPMSTVA